MKNTLKSIIKYLSKRDFYYCYEYDGIYEANECYCVEDILQQAHDSIYTAVCGILGSLRIDPKNDLTDEMQEQLTNEAYEQAERFHLRFKNLSKNKILENIKNNKELKQILFERFAETAHK